jgi:hypothetical protein
MELGGFYSPHHPIRQASMEAIRLTADPQRLAFEIIRQPHKSAERCYSRHDNQGRNCLL